jgi:hypothetical protein
MDLDGHIQHPLLRAGGANALHHDLARNARHVEVGNDQIRAQAAIDDREGVSATGRLGDFVSALDQEPSLQMPNGVVIVHDQNLGTACNGHQRFEARASCT